MYRLIIAAMAMGCPTPSTKGATSEAEQKPAAERATRPTRSTEAAAPEPSPTPAVDLEPHQLDPEPSTYDDADDDYIDDADDDEGADYEDPEAYD